MTLAMLLFGSSVALFLPLHRRPHFWKRLLLCYGVVLPVLLALSYYTQGFRFFLFSSILSLVWGILVAYCCTTLDWVGSCYCSIWILLVAEMLYEIWRFLARLLDPVLGWDLAGPDTPRIWLLQLLLFAVGCVAVHFTIGRGMPEDGAYHIGPRQMLSAVLLGGMFWFQFLSLQKSWGMPQDWSNTFTAISVLTQLYCLTLLYLQTELFKKSAMQKEMDTLNLLYERQRQQYRVARQNVHIINRKCHELKVQIADLRRLNPDAATRKSLDEAEQAAKLYNADLHTGNEVLDVALTEKSLLCESHGIRLNCVADGACLSFMEPGDLYALVANALDPAIEAAARQQDADRAMIDLLLCVRQGFAVLNVIGPEDPTPNAKIGRYELKVVRRVAQKYSGTVTAEVKEGFAALKVLLPLGNTP